MFDQFEEYWKGETVLSPGHRSGGAARDIACDAFIKGYKAAQQKRAAAWFFAGLLTAAVFALVLLVV